MNNRFLESDEHKFNNVSARPPFLAGCFAATNLIVGLVIASISFQEHRHPDLLLMLADLDLIIASNRPNSR